MEKNTWFSDSEKELIKDYTNLSVDEFCDKYTEKIDTIYTLCDYCNTINDYDNEDDSIVFILQEIAKRKHWSWVGDYDINNVFDFIVANGTCLYYTENGTWQTYAREK